MIAYLMKRRGQGTFEYILLLGGVILITTIALFVLVNTTPNVDAQKQCAIASRMALGCFYANGTFRPDSTFDFSGQSTYCDCSNAGAAASTASPSPTATATPSSSPAATPTATPTASPSPTAMPSPSASPTPPGDIRTVKNWAYQLMGYPEADPISGIKASSAELVVIDAFSQDITMFTPIQIQELKSSGKKVIAYMSIGEAEHYRYYWQASWTSTPPAWMGRLNPDWPGNYKVHYWDPAWQSIILGDGGYLDKIVAQGFDGVYLDIVDGYEYWSSPESTARIVKDDGTIIEAEPSFTDLSFTGSRNYLDAQIAAERMIDFIKAIRDRGKLANPYFVVIPQNAPLLVNYRSTQSGLGYVDVMDAIGKEDTWYTDFAPEDTTVNLRTPPDGLDSLRTIKAAGKPVFTVDYFNYATDSAKITDYCAKAAAEGFIPYPADSRTLDDVSKASCSATPSATPPPSLETGLVAHFKLDEQPVKQDAAVTDSSPTQNHGTLLTGSDGVDKSVQGQVGRGFSFDGVNDFVKTLQTSALNFEGNQPFSLAAWVRAGASHGMIVAKEENGGNYRGYYMVFDSSGKLIVRFQNDGTKYAEVVGNTLINNDWFHHVVMTYDGSTQAAGIKLYVDGVLESKTVLKDTLGANTILTNVPFTIGSRDGGGVPLNGIIDDVRVYNRVLSAQEIQEIMNAAPVVPAPIPGTTLMVDASGSTGRVFETDLAGTISWSYACTPYCSSAERLSNGNTLITQQYSVLELDSSKNIVWEFSPQKMDFTMDVSFYPRTAQRLSNGNTLILNDASTGSYAAGNPCNNNACGGVFEVNPFGQVVWQYDQRPSSAQRLSNGNTLVTSYFKVDEVDANGAIVWSYGQSTAGSGAGQLNDPRHATRLSNGNTLIADMRNNRVIEIDASKNIVSTISGLNFPIFAQRVGANTLVAEYSGNRVLEYSTAGVLLWQYGNGVAGTGANQTSLPRAARRIGSLAPASFSPPRPTPAPEVTPIPGSITLIVQDPDKGIKQVDLAGNVQWTYANGQFLDSAQRLSNGNTLIEQAYEGPIFDVNPAGNVVWQFNNPGVTVNDFYPSDIVRLSNGDTLISNIVRTSSKYFAAGSPCNNGGCNGVIQVTPSSTIAWQYIPPSAPKCVERLANGNTLVCLDSRVVEVDSDRNIVWQYGSVGVQGTGPNQLREPTSVQRLSNGNTVITDYDGLLRRDRVVEVTPQKTIASTLYAGQIVRGIRLSNGNTLIAQNGFYRFGSSDAYPMISEVMPDNRVVWRYGTGVAGAGFNQTYYLRGNGVYRVTPAPVS